MAKQKCKEEAAAAAANANANGVGECQWWILLYGSTFVPLNNQEINHIRPHLASH